MITCPKCGRQTPEGAFCSRCGAELAPVAPSAPPVAAAAYDPDDEPTLRGNEEVASRPSLARPTIQRPEFHRVVKFSPPHRIAEHDEKPNLADRSVAVESEPMLAVDRLCVQFEKIAGIVRFYFDPRSPISGLKNVVFTFESQLTGTVVKTRPIRYLNRPRQFPVQFPAQEAGTQVWCVTVEYEDGRRKCRREGDLELLVCRPLEAKQVAANLSISIDNSVTIGDHSANAADITTRGSLIGDHSANAADVQMRRGILESLAKLAKSENPFDELRGLIVSENRSWAKVDLVAAEETSSLPPMPTNARADHIVIDFGNTRTHFFANRTIKFGRKREVNDIALRPSADASEMEMLPYRKVSREHCFFELEGRRAMISDGHRDEFRVVQPSSGGTFWNNEQLRQPVSLPIGTEGIVSFGGVHYGDNLSLDVKVCSPTKACATCPHADRHWCGEGARPTLVLSRRDRIPEKYIAMWSCFWLGDADPSFDGVIIFRKDGAFAYRRDDGRSGWLVPGTTIQTDFGMATVN